LEGGREGKRWRIAGCRPLGLWFLVWRGAEVEGDGEGGAVARQLLLGFRRLSIWEAARQFVVMGHNGPKNSPAASNPHEAAAGVGEWRRSHLHRRHQRSGDAAPGIEEPLILRGAHIDSARRF
jgi:hypothetical protein